MPFLALFDFFLFVYLSYSVSDIVELCKAFKSHAIQIFVIFEQKVGAELAFYAPCTVLSASPDSRVISARP